MCVDRIPAGKRWHVSNLDHGIEGLFTKMGQGIETLLEMVQHHQVSNSRELFPSPGLKGRRQEGLLERDIELERKREREH